MTWLSRLGMNLVARFADGGGGYGYGSTRPEPCKGPVTPIRCCFLACPDRQCPYEGDPANYTCPDGYQRSYWTCCEGGTLVGCGECSTGESCGDGPFYCSIAFDAGCC